ncbi:MAG: TRL domain-containing protein [Myxococcota bacterium]
MARVAAILTAFLLCGCAQGLIYTHVTRPLTINFDRTPVANGSHAKGDVKELRYNAYLRVLWDENSIGSIAKEAGFKEIYYADLETFSVLGIWTQYRVHVYGIEEAPAP